MSEAAPAPSPRAVQLLAIGGGLAASAALVALLRLVAETASDAPILDDWDVVVGFLVYWESAASAAERWHLLFDPHNEHLLALPRLASWLVDRLAGHADFRWLGMLGQGAAVAMLLALHHAFARDRSGAWRMAAFAPASLFVLQPLAWTALTSPTVSLSNLGVLAFGAGCVAALSQPGRVRVGAAVACAVAASFCSANGILVAPVAALVPWLRGDRRLALGWLGIALAGVAAYLVLAPGDHAAADRLALLADPWPIVPYTLTFVGAAGGFGSPVAALAIGTGVVAALLAALRPRIARRSAVPLALALFVLASILANALVRAQQGSAAPLAQPRYAIYSAALLALVHLVWIVHVPRRHQAAVVAACLALALVFSLAAFARGADAARRARSDAEAGLIAWWRDGRSGLRHPDPRKAALFLTRGLGSGVLRLPDEVRAAVRTAPHGVDALPPTVASRVTLEAVHVEADELLVIARHPGSAPAGAEIALASDTATFAADALVVAPSQRGDARRAASSQPRAYGIHALVALGELPGGRYRLGIVDRSGASRRMSWTGVTFDLPAGP